MSGPAPLPAPHDEQALDLSSIPELAAGSFDLPTASRAADAPSIGRELPWTPERRATRQPAARSSPYYDDGTVVEFKAAARVPWKWPAIVAVALGGVAVYALHGQMGGLPRAPRDAASSGLSADAGGASSHEARFAPDTATSSSPGIGESPPATPDPLPAANIDENDAEQRLAIVAAVGDPAAFRRVLTDYTAQFPASPSSRDFGRVLESDLPALTAVASWNALLDRWRDMDMRGLTPSEAAAVMAEAAELLESGVPFSDEPAVRQRCRCLAAVAARIDDSGQVIQQPLSDMLRQPALEAGLMLRTVGGKSYYMKDRPVKEDDHYRGEYLVDLQSNSKSLDIPYADVDRDGSGASPQVELSQAMQGILDGLDHANWESSFFRILSAISREERLDPLLKAIWLERVMDVACRGSEPLRGALAPCLEKLQLLRLHPEPNWLDPDDPDAQRIRSAAVDVLKELPPIREVVAPAVAEHRALRAFPVASRLAWVGCLMREEAGAWWCKGDPAAALGDGPLFVIHRPTPAGAYQVRQVGSVTEGRVVFLAGASEFMREGRPVYLDVVEDAPPEDADSVAPGSSS